MKGKGDKGVKPSEETPCKTCAKNPALKNSPAQTLCNLGQDQDLGYMETGKKLPPHYMDRVMIKGQAEAEELFPVVLTQHVGIHSIPMDELKLILIPVLKTIK